MKPESKKALKDMTTEIKNGTIFLYFEKEDMILKQDDGLRIVLLSKPSYYMNQLIKDGIMSLCDVEGLIGFHINKKEKSKIEFPISDGRFPLTCSGVKDRKNL